MLALSRRELEEIYLTTEDGTPIVVTIVSIDRGKVRVGISAPRSVNIARGELLTDAQRADLDRKANT